MASTSLPLRGMFQMMRSGHPDGALCGFGIISHDAICTSRKVLLEIQRKSAPHNCKMPMHPLHYINTMPSQQISNTAMVDSIFFYQKRRGNVLSKQIYRLAGAHLLPFIKIKYGLGFASLCSLQWFLAFFTFPLHNKFCH